MIGALLRGCYQIVATRLADGFSEAGLAPLQGAVTQPLWAEPKGLRLTELASLAGMTKQAMGELVEQMEVAGYVERVDDPTDGRARLLRLTSAGRRAGRLARKIVRDVETEWATTFGTSRVRNMEEVMREILARESGNRSRKVD